MLIILVLGILISLIGGIWTISIAFGDEPFRGWLCIFLGPVGMTIYAADNWNKVKLPFLILIVGQVLLGAWLMLE